MKGSSSGPTPSCPEWSAIETAWQARDWEATIDLTRVWIAKQKQGGREKGEIAETGVGSSVEHCTIHQESEHGSISQAFYVQALAREALEQWNKAAAAIEACVSAHQPGGIVGGADFVQAMRVERRIQKNQKLDAQAAASQLPSQAASQESCTLAHARQQLRLHLRSTLPERLEANTWINIPVCLVNEFHLFSSQHHFPLERNALPMQVTLQSLGKETSTTILRMQDAQVHQNGKATGSFQIPTAPLSDSQTIVIQFAIADEANASSILPVASLPYSWKDNALVAASLRDATAADLGVSSCRPIRFLPTVPAVWVGEAPGQGGIGGKVWDSSLVLMRYLYQHRDQWMRGKRVLELGSGVGLVGIGMIVACQQHDLPTSLLLTDLPEIVPLIEYNLTLNRISSSYCTACPYAWGSGACPLHPPPDTIWLSDVVYHPEGFRPLVEALVACSTPDTQIVMAHRSRHDQDSTFFHLLAKAFSFRIVETHPPDIRMFHIQRHTEPQAPTSLPS